MNDDKWLELPEPAPHGCDCCDPTSPSPDPVVVRLEREVDRLNFDLCQCRSELTTAREIAHRLGTEREELRAEVERLNTAYGAIDRANESLQERLAAAQTRNQ